MANPQIVFLVNVCICTYICTHLRGAQFVSWPSPASHDRTENVIHWGTSLMSWLWKYNYNTEEEEIVWTTCGSGKQSSVYTHAHAHACMQTHIHADTYCTYMHTYTKRTTHVLMHINRYIHTYVHIGTPTYCTYVPGRGHPSAGRSTPECETWQKHQGLYGYSAVK